MPNAPSLSFLAGLLLGAGGAALGLATWRGVVTEDPLAALKAGDALVVASVADGVRLHPGRQERRQDGPYPWTISVNAQGFREGDPTPPERPPGTRRILGLGDSWMFGYGVDQEATLSEQLEALLPARLGVPVEVVNAGVFGAGAFDVLRRYHRLVESYTFDGVLLTRPHNGARNAVTRDQRDLWYAGAARGSLPFYLPFELRLRTLLAPPRPTPPRASPHADPNVVDIWNLVVDAKGRGLDVWVVETPTYYDAQRRAVQSGDRLTVQALAELQVPIARLRLEDRSCWGFTDRAHASEAGTRVMAEHVAEVIAADRTLGPEAPGSRCAEVPGAGPGKGEWPLTAFRGP